MGATLQISWRKLFLFGFRFSLRSSSMAVAFGARDVCPIRPNSSITLSSFSTSSDQNASISQVTLLRFHVDTRGIQVRRSERYQIYSPEVIYHQHFLCEVGSICP